MKIPIRMRMTPPATSARDLKRLPNTFPIFTPQALKRKVQIPNEPQEEKTQPVVDSGDEATKLAAEHKAQKWHDGLRAPEPKPGDEQMLWLRVLYAEPLTDRDGKGVHRDTYSDD